MYLLVKPASSLCNLRCNYCFYHDIAANREIKSYGFMSEDTMEIIIKKALAYAKNECTIAFQGGEPTLIGLDFFKKVIAFQNKYNDKHLIIHNALQTNGYKLDEKWAEFFAENHFLIGVSVDGTKHTHDKYRMNAEGGDTFIEIMKTIDLFEKHKVQYNILTVVNSYTALSIDKIYRYFKKMNFKYLQFIPCLDPIGVESGSLLYSLTPKVYGNFLKKLFDLWYDDYVKGTPVSIRQFDNYISMLAGYPAESCDMNGFCSIQNVIEADGEVYPCDFYILDYYKLGNLTKCSFEDIMQKRTELSFIEESIVTDENCLSCNFYKLCRGGCKRHRLMSENTAEFNYFCESYKEFFPYALKRMVSLSRLIQ